MWKMRIIPSNILPQCNKESLHAFLDSCRNAARSKGRFQLASISLEVKHIAPLAVLQSIYDPEELHFYVERVADEEALAGAESVIEETFEGPTRFAQVKSFAQEILENTIATGNLNEPFAGPSFFTAFAFDDQVPSGSAFPAATVFVPHWQVSRSGGNYGAVLNVQVDPSGDLRSLVEKVWSAYRKFSDFDYTEKRQGSAERFIPKTTKQIEPDVSIYEDLAGRALEAIGCGDYEKIVLARSLCLKADRPWQPLEALDRLREQFSGCFAFSFGGGAGRSFIGATPERLLKIRGGHLKTEAIAGSAPRGITPAEDARFARELLESEKDLREHAYVRNCILRSLASVGIEGRAEAGPRLLPLANVQHLQTSINAFVGQSAHLMDIVREMHPTPAVGGAPREKAVPAIADLEQIDRGLFAGVVGWFNHLNEGEMIVGIRSALIENQMARLYAGAGIVEGSDPDKEFRETEMKLNALLNGLTK